MRPPLTRIPLIQSGYANPVKNWFLKEALLALIDKLVVEKVVVRSSLSFYNWLFLVPKPNNKWRPILDLSQLNLYLASGTFKMETPETIRLSLQKGEWVTSLDFSNAYFHIPINHKSRKFLRFFLNKQTYQFTALPFNLATAPLEFTKVVKEVKLMAQTRGIRIHQHQDDWLLRAPYQKTCRQHTQTLLALCPVRDLGWVVNLKKSELTPQQDFNFVGYQFNLLTGRVLATQERWLALQQKLQFVKTRDRCTVRQFMSLIGLLTATEKKVWSGRLHMRLGKSYRNSSISPSTSRLVVRQEKCTLGSSSPSSKPRSGSLYRRLKRRLGRTSLQEACGQTQKVASTSIFWS